MNQFSGSSLNKVAVKARVFIVTEFPVDTKIRNPLRRVPKVVPYNNDARDADGDGLVQEGTIWERPVGTRYLSKLGEWLKNGLRAIPSASSLVDGDGNKVTYRPGQHAKSPLRRGRGMRERRIRGRGQRRLRRARANRARAQRDRDRVGEAREEISNIDKHIQVLEGASNPASRQRLLDAEAARGDAPMDENYRGFWDSFFTAFTGSYDGQSNAALPKKDRDNAGAAVAKAIKLEGERRAAGGAVGNEPDREREMEMDDKILPPDVDRDEHRRMLDEDPEYLAEWIRRLVEYDGQGYVNPPGRDENARVVTDKPGSARNPAHLPGGGGGDGHLIDIPNATDEQIGDDIGQEEYLIARDASSERRPIDGDTRSADPAYLKRLKAERQRRIDAGEWIDPNERRRNRELNERVDSARQQLVEIIEEAEGRGVRMPNQREIDQVNHRFPPGWAPGVWDYGLPERAFWRDEDYDGDVEGLERLFGRYYDEDGNINARGELIDAVNRQMVKRDQALAELRGEEIPGNSAQQAKNELEARIRYWQGRRDNWEDDVDFRDYDGDVERWQADVDAEVARYRAELADLEELKPLADLPPDPDEGQRSRTPQWMGVVEADPDQDVIPPVRPDPEPNIEEAEEVARGIEELREAVPAGESQPDDRSLRNVRNRFPQAGLPARAFWREDDYEPGGGRDAAEQRELHDRRFGRYYDENGELNDRGLLVQELLREEREAARGEPRLRPLEEIGSQRDLDAAADRAQRLFGRDQVPADPEVLGRIAEAAERRDALVTPERRAEYVREFADLEDSRLIWQIEADESDFVRWERRDQTRADHHAWTLSLLRAELDRRRERGDVRGDTDPREDTRGEIEAARRSGDEMIMDGIRHQIELGVEGDINWTEREVQRFVQAAAEEPDGEMERLERLAEVVENAVDVQDGLVHGRLRRSYQARLNELRRLNVNPERGDTDPRQDTRGEVVRQQPYGEVPRFGPMSPNEEHVFEPGWGEQAAGWAPDQQRAWLHADDPDAGNQGEVPQQRRAVERALFENLIQRGGRGTDAGSLNDRIVGTRGVSVEDWDDQDLNTVLRRLREDREIERPGGRQLFEQAAEEARRRGLDVDDPRDGGDGFAEDFQATDNLGRLQLLLNDPEPWNAERTEAARQLAGDESLSTDHALRLQFRLDADGHDDDLEWAVGNVGEAPDGDAQPENIVAWVQQQIRDNRGLGFGGGADLDELLQELSDEQLNEYIRQIAAGEVRAPDAVGFDPNVAIYFGGRDGAGQTLRPRGAGGGGLAYMGNRLRAERDRRDAGTPRPRGPQRNQEFFEGLGEDPDRLRVLEEAEFVDIIELDANDLTEHIEALTALRDGGELPSLEENRRIGRRLAEMQEALDEIGKHGRQRPRMRTEAREHLLTLADSDAIHAIIRDEDDGFVSAGLRIDNMDAETRAEWRELAQWESRKRTVGDMSDEELEQDIETVEGWAANEPGRERWLALYRAEQTRRRNAGDSEARLVWRAQSLLDEPDAWNQEQIDDAAALATALSRVPLVEEDSRWALYERLEQEIQERLDNDGRLDADRRLPVPVGDDRGEVAADLLPTGLVQDLNPYGPAPEFIERSERLIDYGAQAADWSMRQMRAWLHRDQRRNNHGPDGEVPVDRRAVERALFDAFIPHREGDLARPGEDLIVGDISDLDDQDIAVVIRRLREDGWGRRADRGPELMRILETEQQRRRGHDPRFFNEAQIVDAVGRLDDADLGRVGGDEDRGFEDGLGLNLANLRRGDREAFRQQARLEMERRRENRRPGTTLVDLGNMNRRELNDRITRLILADPDGEDDGIRAQLDGVLLHRDRRLVEDSGRSPTAAYRLAQRNNLQALDDQEIDDEIGNVQAMLRSADDPHAENAESLRERLANALAERAERRRVSGIPEVPEARDAEVPEVPDADIPAEFRTEWQNLQGRFDMFDRAARQEVTRVLSNIDQRIYNRQQRGESVSQLRAFRALVTRRRDEKNFKRGVEHLRDGDIRLVGDMEVHNQHISRIHEMAMLGRLTPEQLDEVLEASARFEGGARRGGGYGDAQASIRRFRREMVEAKHLARVSLGDEEERRLRGLDKEAFGEEVTRVRDALRARLAEDPPNAASIGAVIAEELELLKIADELFPERAERHGGIHRVLKNSVQTGLNKLREVIDRPREGQGQLLSPIEGVEQRDFSGEDHADAVREIGSLIDGIKRKIKRSSGRWDRGEPARGNDHRQGVPVLAGYEANVDRALADVERRINAERAGTTRRRELTSLRTKLRNLKGGARGHGIAEERGLRQGVEDARIAEVARKNAEAIEGFRRGQSILAGLDLDSYERAVEAVDDAGAPRLKADMDQVRSEINGLRGGNALRAQNIVDEAERPANADQIITDLRAAENRLKGMIATIEHRAVVQENRNWIAANEARIEEIRAFIDAADAVDVPEAMDLDIRRLKGELADLPKLPQGVAERERKSELRNTLRDLMANREQEINARHVKHQVDVFAPRVNEMLGELEAGRVGEDNIDANIAEIGAMVDEVKALPAVPHHLDVNQARQDMKAKVIDLHARLKDERRNIVLGPRVDPVAWDGAVMDPVALARPNLGLRERPAGLGVAGDVDENGFVRMHVVPVGHMGLDTQIKADKHVRAGGNISDIPDDFLAMALLENASDKGEPIGDNRFSIVVKNGGQIGTTYVLVQRRPDGSLGPEGFLIKAHPRLEGQHNESDSIGELVGAELAHNLGMPVIPGRTNGKIDLRRGNAKGVAIVMEHAWNSAQGADSFPTDITSFSLDRLPDGNRALGPRLENLMVNWLLGVGDRHSLNGLLAANADGDVAVTAIDLAWVGRAGNPRIKNYNFGMDSGLLREIKDAARADPAVRQAIEAQIRVIIERFNAISSDRDRRNALFAGGVYADKLTKDNGYIKRKLDAYWRTFGPDDAVDVERVISDVFGA